MRRLPAVLAFLYASVLIGCGSSDRREALARGGDTGFAAVQGRGAEAMGVDQYSSSHVFEPLPDGGRIVLKRNPMDSVGVATIRAHMRLIADRFAAGDFRLPGFVHARTVPGTAMMAARRAEIRYTADTVPGGAQLRIRTSDEEARDAVHEFLAFQRRDHHAPAHEH
jgi:hypothetical protein